MSFSTSTAVFQNIFMANGEDENLSQAFFDAALAYLKERRSIEEADMLYTWIDDGHPIYGFMCRQDVVRDVADEFIVEKIPFLCVSEPKGDVGFMIRACDHDSSNAVKEKVLLNRAKLCKILTGDELKKSILKSKESDKEVLFVSNLSAEQIEILTKLCEENIDDAVIGVDEMEDETYTFSIHGKKVMGTGKPLSSLNQIFVLLMLASKGLDADVNKRIARNTRMFNLAMARGFKLPNMDLRRSPAWVVGKGKHYMQINNEGFEYGIAMDTENGIEMHEQYTVDANSPDYQAQLTSYLSRIEDKTVTHDARQAQKHLAGKEASLNYSRNNDQRLVALFEKQITQKADEIVNRKIRSDPVMTLDGRWDEKLEHYLSEVAKLIDGARMDMIPEGYTRKDIEEIQKIGDSHAIKLEAYAPSITAMRNMETTLAKALPTRTRNVGEKIQSHTKTQERKEISKEELSKSIHSASRASKTETRKKEEGAEPVK